MTRKQDRLEWRSIYQKSIDEMIADERQKEHKIMGFSHAIIRVAQIDTGISVEFHVVEPTIAGINEAIRQLNAAGYVKPVSQSSANRPDNAGKIGKVSSVTKVEGKNQWNVVIALADNGGEQKLIAFAATAYRKGDRVRLSRNEKGYYEATIINDEGADGEKQDSIPF